MQLFISIPIFVAIHLYQVIAFNCNVFMYLFITFSIFVAVKLYQPIAAFADDLLFFITNPTVTLPNLMLEFERFHALSNFKINYGKSEALNVSYTSSLVESLQGAFLFKWSPSTVKYLGTILPRQVSDMFSVNFPPLLRSIRSDLCYVYPKMARAWRFQTPTSITRHAT